MSCVPQIRTVLKGYFQTTTAQHQEPCTTYQVPSTSLPKTLLPNTRIISQFHVYQGRERERMRIYRSQWILFIFILLKCISNHNQPTNHTFLCISSTHKGNAKSFIITQFSEVESHEKLTAKTLHLTLHSFIEATFLVSQTFFQLPATASNLLSSICLFKSTRVGRIYGFLSSFLIHLHFGTFFSILNSQFD